MVLWAEPRLRGKEATSQGDTIAQVLGRLGKDLTLCWEPESQSLPGVPDLREMHLEIFNLNVVNSTARCHDLCKPLFSLLTIVVYSEKKWFTRPMPPQGAPKTSQGFSNAGWIK